MWLVGWSYRSRAREADLTHSPAWEQENRFLQFSSSDLIIYSKMKDEKEDKKYDKTGCSLLVRLVKIKEKKVLATIVRWISQSLSRTCSVHISSRIFFNRKRIFFSCNFFCGIFHIFRTIIHIQIPDKYFFLMQKLLSHIKYYITCTVLWLYSKWLIDISNI